VRSADGVLPLSGQTKTQGNCIPLSTLRTRWQAILFCGTKHTCRLVYLWKGGAPIAIYHCSIKIISRGKGKSAVAAAAYRAGEKIKNEYDGIEHDYTRKGGIVHTEILLPDNAPAEYQDRAVLWNAVEKIEKAKNSQLAREIEIALPIELTKEQNISIVREYVKQHFVGAGMCADFAVHDTNSGNPHAHIMLTMRPFNEDRTWGDKQKKKYILDSDGHKIYNKNNRSYKCKSIPTTDWNDQTKAEEWRQGWAEICNRVLEQNNHTERIDHRSYERQSIDQIPTIHLGVAASAMEKRGIKTDRGNINREIEVNNQRLRQLRARIGKLQKWINDEVKMESFMQKSNPIPSENLLSILLDMLNTDEGKSQRRKIIDLKSVSNVVEFLQANGIAALSELSEKVNAMRGEFNTVRENLKPVEHRLKTLDEHIKQADNYKKYRAVHKQYKAMKPKQQAAFYNNHAAEIILYTSAEKYLKAHLNGRDKIPLPAWKAEHEKLTAEKGSLYREFYRQKDEVRKVEIIQKAVEHIVRECSRSEQSITKNRGMEL